MGSELLLEIGTEEIPARFVPPVLEEMAASFRKMLDQELIAVGDSNLNVLNQLLGRLAMEKYEVVTIYHGTDAVSEEVELINRSISEQYPHVQVELIKGGQPHYSYIISVE